MLLGRLDLITDSLRAAFTNRLDDWGGRSKQRGALTARPPHAQQDFALALSNLPNSYARRKEGPCL